MKTYRLSFFICITLLLQNAFITTATANEGLVEIPPLVQVSMKTSAGEIILELNTEKAPLTVTNFLKYVEEGFYENTLFHRVIPDFMAQGGGYEKGMMLKETHLPVNNETYNGLKNIRGSIAMARTRNPDSATSQFYINVVNNPNLDLRGNNPGYTVFGKVIDGMEIIDLIVKAPTKKSGRHHDVPEEDIVILSAMRIDRSLTYTDDELTDKEVFLPGLHYTVLDRPIVTRDAKKIEVVGMFSYACPHCYEFEPMISAWNERQAEDVDYWYFPAVWNDPMKLYAQAYYTAKQLGIVEKIHFPLFNLLVVEQKSIRNKNDLAGFFAEHGINNKTFLKVFNSSGVKTQVKQAESRVRNYKPASVPEIIVNGKYRVDRMRAGGQAKMLSVVDFLVSKERALQKR